MKKGTWIAIISVAALSVLIAISLMQMSPNPAISDKMNQSIAKIKVRYAMVNASEEFQEIVEEAAGDDFEQTEIPEKTPEPTPEPIGENVQVTSSNATPEPELTQEQKNMEAAKEGVSLVYMPQPGDVPEISGPAVILTDKPHIIPENTSGVTFDGDAVAMASWEVLYSYPSHCFPVRTLSLFASDKEAGYKIQQEMVAEGKLQDKGTYFFGTGMGTPEKWTERALAEIPVGLLDTIYAENAELAKAAYAALKAANRNDSVEVICAELTEELVSLMIEDHWLMGACVGVRGSRVHGIVRELCGENIDVINYTSNTKLFIQRALSPAKVNSINIDEENMKAEVYLQPEEVSLAIGRSGMNIKLASMLTGYTIDVFREVENNDEEDIYLDEFSDEIDQWVIDAIKGIGLETAKQVLNAPREMLIEKADLEEETVDNVIKILKAEFDN